MQQIFEHLEHFQCDGNDDLTINDTLATRSYTPTQNVEPCAVALHLMFVIFRFWLSHICTGRHCHCHCEAAAKKQRSEKDNNDIASSP